MNATSGKVAEAGDRVPEVGFLKGDSPPSQNHIPALDGLRGVAILMVLAIHFIFLVKLPKPPIVHWMFPVLVTGWMGVDLFFVLSGFLITGILLDTRLSSNYFRSFYARRTLRIFPLYYAVILGGMLLTPYLRHSPYLITLTPSYPTWFSYLVYLQNWWVPLTGASLTTIVGDYWSLGVEEQFYLIWPLIIYKLSPRKLLPLCLGLSVVCFLFRIVLLHHNPASAFVFTNTSTRMDTLLWGGIAAILIRTPNLFARIEPLLQYVIYVCIGVVVFIDFGLHELYTRAFYTQSFGYTAIAIGFTAFLLKVYSIGDRGGVLDRCLTNSLLRSIGRYSYGMYIFHAFILFAIVSRYQASPWFGHSLLRGIGLACIFLLLTYTIAFASYHLYEVRFLRLKSRFKPSNLA